MATRDNFKVDRQKLSVAISEAGIHMDELVVKLDSVFAQRFDAPTLKPLFFEIS